MRRGIRKKPLKKKVSKLRKLAKRLARPAKPLKNILRTISRKKSHNPLLNKKIGRLVAAIVNRPEGENSAAGFELPSRYGKNKLVLLVRDPWWIYGYWEVTPEREKQVLREMLGLGLQKDKTVLRVYDVTGTSVSRANASFDIELNFFADNWYIDVGKPDADWVAELGLRAANGRFFPLVRSNTVRTPRFGLSDVWDEEWMMPDELYWKLFGRMTGLSEQKSSLNVREILERYLKGMVSSQAFSPAKKS